MISNETFLPLLLKGSRGKEIFCKKLVAQVEQRVMLDALTGRGRKEVEELDWK